MLPPLLPPELPPTVTVTTPPFGGKPPTGPTPTDTPPPFQTGIPPPPPTSEVASGPMGFGMGLRSCMRPPATKPISSIVSSRIMGIILLLLVKTCLSF
ncbi:hypothetical protein CAP40_13590 [Sphingomonas sp. IBVSS2]|nr:hypothetical protein CAP40_13590 [Sphingomonas sp. IBVSS2]